MFTGLSGSCLKLGYVLASTWTMIPQHSFVHPPNDRTAVWSLCVTLHTYPLSNGADVISGRFTSEKERCQVQGRWNMMKSMTEERDREERGSPKHCVRPSRACCCDDW